MEAMILPALQQGGYAYETQVRLGQRLGFGKHIVDAVAHKHGRNILISLKWQQVSGTAEQKVPFEMICLLEAVGGELLLSPQSVEIIKFGDPGSGR